MFQKLLTIAAWTLLAFIAFATLSPLHDRPTLHTSASFEHLAAFAVLGLLFCLAYPRHVVLICLLVFGSAVMLELAQHLTADRHGRIQDAVEKMAGSALGVIVGRVFIYFNRKNLIPSQTDLSVVREKISARLNER